MLGEEDHDQLNSHQLTKHLTDTHKLQGVKKKSTQVHMSMSHIHGHLGLNQTLKNVDFFNQENGNVKKKQNEVFFSIGYYL